VVRLTNKTHLSGELQKLRVSIAVTKCSVIVMSRWRSNVH